VATRLIMERVEQQVLRFAQDDKVFSNFARDDKVFSKMTELLLHVSSTLVSLVLRLGWGLERLMLRSVAVPAQAAVAAVALLIFFDAFEQVHASEIGP
jgi:hypothetical protein